jgi:hypothetical protein
MRVVEHHGEEIQQYTVHTCGHYMNTSMRLLLRVVHLGRVRDPVGSWRFLPDSDPESSPPNPDRDLALVM